METLKSPGADLENKKFIFREIGLIIALLRGIGGGCDKEAIRVVENMPDWIPGRQRNVPVRVLFNLPVRFKLQ